MEILISNIVIMECIKAVMLILNLLLNIDIKYFKFIFVKFIIVPKIMYNMLNLVIINLTILVNEYLYFKIKKLK